MQKDEDLTNTREQSKYSIRYERRSTRY